MATFWSFAQTSGSGCRLPSCWSVLQQCALVFLLPLMKSFCREGQNAEDLFLQYVVSVITEPPSVESPRTDHKATKKNLWFNSTENNCTGIHLIDLNCVTWIVHYWLIIIFYSADQMCVARGTTPTAAQAGRLWLEETSALFVSIISTLPQLLLVQLVCKFRSGRTLKASGELSSAPFFFCWSHSEYYTCGIRAETISQLLD